MGQVRAAVLTAQDRLLLALEGRLPHPLGHLQDRPGDAFDLQVIGVDQVRKQPRGDALEFADLRQPDELATGGGLGLGIGPGVGVAEGQPFDPFWGLAHDLLGDVAAHGEARQGKGPGGARQDSFRYGGHGVVLGQIAHGDLCQVGQMVDLVTPQGRVIQKSRQEDQMVGGHATTIR